MIILFIFKEFMDIGIHQGSTHRQGFSHFYNLFTLFSKKPIRPAFLV